MKSGTLTKLEKATDIASVAVAGAVFAIKLAGIGQRQRKRNAMRPP